MGTALYRKGYLQIEENKARLFSRRGLCEIFRMDSVLIPAVAGILGRTFPDNPKPVFLKRLACKLPEFLQHFGMHKFRSIRNGIWLVFLIGMTVQAREWTELDGVAYEENDANDGDSFHAKRNSSKYLLRLYFVDTPETDQRYPDRVQTQAEYFGVTPEQAVEGAKEAAEYVRKLLKDKPLTVHTRYANARGASAMKRYYSMVEVDGRWLSELLVEQGYARVYGMGSELPDGTSQEKYWSRLRKLEKEAKEKNRGLWGVASGELDVTQLKPGQEVTLPRATMIFRSEPPHQVVGQLPAEWAVTLGPVSRPGFRQVTFTSPGGSVFTGDLQESALK